MKRIITTLNKSGQMTMPVEIQRLLGVKPRDRVTYVVDNGTVTLRPTRTLESVIGAVPAIPGTTTADFDRQIEEATAEVADEFMRKFNQQ